MGTRSFLIVDDDERFGHLMAQRLKQYAKCVISTDGEDALTQFKHQYTGETPFTAVFMDIEMPNMSGHEVVRRMREIEDTQRVGPINEFKLIMLTAHKDVKNVSASFFKGGADAYIPKDAIDTLLDAELSKINVI